ncbi:hypothetical protein JHK86_004980 [Glycine max]|nr:hypothetical protein JHK86_004980 [Glycine max]
MLFGHTVIHYLIYEQPFCNPPQAQPPKDGFIKINSDGSYVGNPRAFGFGSIVRDSSG